MITRPIRFDRTAPHDALSLLAAVTCAGVPDDRYVRPQHSILKLVRRPGGRAGRGVRLPRCDALGVPAPVFYALSELPETPVGRTRVGARTRGTANTGR